MTMKPETIAQLHSQFEQIVKTDTEGGTEFWMARDLQNLLGYSEWRNFLLVIEKAKIACKGSKQTVLDHFVDVNKMVSLVRAENNQLTHSSPLSPDHIHP